MVALSLTFIFFQKNLFFLELKKDKDVLKNVIF